MKIRPPRFLIPALFFAGALIASATEFDLGKMGTLTVDTPKGWTVQSKLSDNTGYAFTFESPGETHAKALILLFKLPRPQAVDRAEIDRNFTAVCERFVAQSVEGKAVLKPYKLQEGYGVYAVFTDRSLVGKPVVADDYKVMAPGILQPNASCQMVVTLFADDASGPEFAAMHKLVEGLRLTASHQP
jgi:hypothetical protein